MNQAVQFNLVPVVPTWLIAVVVIGLLALLAHGSTVLKRKNVPRKWIAILGAMRIAIIVVFVFCLLQPVVAIRRTQKQRPTLMVMVDTSKSMALPAGQEGQSRLKDAIARFRGTDMASKINENYDVAWFAFDNEVRPISPEDLDTLEPAGGTTRIMSGIASAWSRASAQARTEQGAARAGSRVLLITDGNDREGRSAESEAQRLGLAVDALLPLPHQAAGSAASDMVTDVQSNPRVLVGSETRFRVVIERAGTEPVERMLVMTENDKVVAERPVRFDKGVTQMHAIIAHKPLSAGPSRYTFKLKDQQPEPFGVNVQVVDNKHEVLVLEDSWRWEFKYLRRVLEDDPSFNMTAMLSRGKVAFVQFGEPDRKVNLGGFPQGAAEVGWFDTIIIGDSDPTRWPRDLSAAIAEGVRDRGKSLIVIAGPQIKHIADSPWLAPLMPVEIGSETGEPIEGPIEVRLSEEAARSPLLAATPDADAPLVKELPAMERIYAPVRKKPAATVLMEAATQANPYGKLIVMAEHTVGRGRVLYIGTDTLWKLQMLGELDAAHKTPYERFWQQALRAMAPARPASGAINVWMLTDKTRTRSGQTVSLRAEIDPPSSAAEVKVETTVTLPDGRRIALPLATSSKDPAVLAGRFETSEPGRYTVTSTATREGKAVAQRTMTIENLPAATEDDDLHLNVEAMNALASATGGRIIDPADPKTWPDLDKSTETVVARAVTVDLWNNYTLMLLLCALLGIDWMLRLVRGYV